MMAFLALVSSSLLEPARNEKLAPHIVLAPDFDTSVVTLSQVMRALLMVGTVVDAIPDVAILLGLLAGLVVAVVGKARAVITPTEQRRTPPISVRNVMKNVPGLARRV